MMIINSVNTAVALTASESNQACVTVENVQNCCEKAQIIQTDKPCCSRLKVDCPVKQIKITLANGTFTVKDIAARFVGSISATSRATRAASAVRPPANC